MDNEKGMLNADGLVLSQAYEDTMEGLVLPFLAGNRRDLVLPGFEGRPLFCSAFDAQNPRGTVLLLHGFTGNVEKFDELIFSLVHCGYSVFAYDLRGHGRSWREDGIPDPSVTHVDRFEEYSGDLEQVIRQGTKDMPRPLYVFAHSMGGAMAALYMEKHRGVFRRAVLCAPMIALETGGVPLPLCRAVCAVPSALGASKKRVFAVRPYHGRGRFESANATGKERFDWYERFRENRTEFHNCCPTYGWIREALKVTGQVLKEGEAEKICEPVLLFGAGMDRMVSSDAQRRFIQRVRCGQMETVPGAKHEIYRSGDEVLFPWWHRVLMFLAEG